MPLIPNSLGPTVPHVAQNDLQKAPLGSLLQTYTSVSTRSSSATYKQEAAAMHDGL